MKKFPSYSLVLTLVLGLLLASCGKKERVIPKEKMAEIYAERYVLDQWLDDNRSLRREADTSLVYAPVLEKYGYTYDDYLNSVNAYMKDPTRYSRILRRTSEILGDRLTELKAEKKAQEDALKESRRLDSLRNLVHLNVDSLMNSMVRTNPSDSLVAALDSLGLVDFRFVQTSDTTYDGPAMVIRTDSLAVAADSLVVAADSLVAVTDVSSADSGRTRQKNGAEGVDGKSDLQRKESPALQKVELTPEHRSFDEQSAGAKARRRRLVPSNDALKK